ncbi:MAG: serine/threonine protein kinase [Myxococcales bacterium]|nr:serine/threonine protein kinase [Myxococcales bacterium]
MNAVPLSPGAILDGKYRIERVLGQGGMGLVFAAVHLELDERVAIKLLLGAPSEAGAQRFLTEARAAAKVRSEHVCRAFDFGRTPSGEPYIVMEYLDGHDLGDELAARGPLSAEEVVEWGRQACEGLAVAHALGIVHRDIKPANLFLASPAHGGAGVRTLKVLDFGVSKAPGSSVTRSAAAMGSPLYMAPEQMASSRDVDARADVWSLGATLYEVASGSPPFDTDNVLELATMIRDVEAPDLSAARPDLPASLCAVVARCLRKEPALRFRDAAELRAALGEVFGPPTAASSAASPPPPVTHRAAAPATAAVAALEATQRAVGATAPGSTSSPSRLRWPLAVGLLSLTALAATALAVRGRQGDATDTRPPLTAPAAASSATASSSVASPAMSATAAISAAAPSAPGPLATSSAKSVPPPRPPVFATAAPPTPAHTSHGSHGGHGAPPTPPTTPPRL